jgi:23S rRNA pseudouridine2605 synthase
MKEIESKSKKTTRKVGSEPQKETPNAEGTRLNVVLQQHGIASRRKADELIEQGLVKVNGKVIKKLGTRVLSNDKVSVEGKILRTEVPKMTLLLHKPDRTITSRNDPQGRETIFDLPSLRDLPRNVQAVGRLDYRSEGLIILTNDGDLAYALTHPKFSVEKIYAVLLADVTTPAEMDKIRRGVQLDDGLAKPTSVRVGGRVDLGSPKKGQWVEVVVGEGRNRLVRRMFESLGLKVVRLVRTGVGDLTLPENLSPAHSAQLRPEQAKYLEKVKKAIGTKPASASKSLVKKKVTKTHLSDADYELEVERRSMELEQRRQARNEKLGITSDDSESPKIRPRRENALTIPAKNPATAAPSRIRKKSDVEAPASAPVARKKESEPSKRIVPHSDDKPIKPRKPKSS